MKRTLVLALVVAGVWSATLPAEETPEQQLDYVRKLRAKGYHDLSKEYIDILLKTHPALAGQLSLEQARALVAIAREKPADQRGKFFNDARVKFEEFVKKNDGKPEAVQARLEMAKLVAYHGQAVLTKALRDNEDAKEQHEAARKAETLFVQAGVELDIVIKQLGEKDQGQARFDRGVNFIDQARTYVDTDKDANRAKRAELMLEAKKVFQAMATDTTSEEGVLANAWLVKVFNDGQDPTEAEKHLKKVLGAEGKAAVPGQRLARYFAIQFIPKNISLNKLKPLEKVKMIKDEANKWIKDYGPLSIKTWEGQGVRFELANAYMAEAQLVDKDFKSAASLAILNNAQKLFTSLADLDGDFSEDANRNTIFIAVRKLEKVKLEDIRDFENSLLKGHYEVYKAGQLATQIDEAKSEADKKKLEGVRKQHLRDAVRAVTQALLLADGTTPLTKIDEARFLLMRLHFLSGDAYRATIASEALGRSLPPTKRAPQGIAMAFRAYDDISVRDDTEANRQRVRDLAEYVLSPALQKFWANEQITGVAHHRLGILHNKDKQFKEAIAHLEKIQPDFPGFIYAQGQLAFIALGAARENAKLTDEERKALRATARSALKKMPATLPSDAEATTATMYFHAQMEEARFLYSDAAGDLKAGKLADAAAKYKQMGKFVDGHFDTLKKSPLKFEDKTKADLTSVMATLGKYSKLGLADVEYRLGAYDKVLGPEGVGAVVTQAKEWAKKEGKIKTADHAVVGDALGLALRAYVQKADLDNAKQVFDVLGRLTGDEEGGFEADNSNTMFQLVGDIQRQINGLKGDPAKAEQLKTALDNYGKFIDGVAESILKAKAGPSEYKFLGDAYKSLEQPGKAAELYAKIPAPKSLDAKTPSEDEKKEIQTYWFLQIQYATALREGKDFKKAYGVLERLINHPNGQYHILAEMEKLFVLEDNNTLGTAIKGWSSIMGRLRDKAGEDNQIKKLYFDCYFYNARCWYKYSQSKKIQEAGKEDQFLTSAARYIINLEAAKSRDGWNMVGDQFNALLDAEPKLRQAYEKLKKDQAPAAQAGK